MFTRALPIIAIVLAMTFIGDTAGAERRVVNATNDFVLFEFSDPFEEKVTSYTIASHNIRFDKSDADTKDFVGLIYNVNVRIFIEEALERRFRSINPTYPNACNLFGSNKDIGCEIGSIYVTAKLSIKADKKETLTICDERYSGPFGNCNADNGYSYFGCSTGFDNATPSRLRECVSDNLNDFFFFYPTKELSEYLTGEKLHLRLELIEATNPTQPEKTSHRVLGKFDFPSDNLLQLQQLFNQREKLVKDAFSGNPEN